MSRTIVSGLLVALLVVTAGCVGGGPGAAPDAGSMDGGGSDGGSGGGDGGDAVSIVENRTAALREAGSYTSVWRMQSLEDGEVVGETAYVTALNYGAERYSFEMRTTQDGETRTSAAAYYADGRSYQRIGEGEEATYASSAADFDTISQVDRAAFVSSSGSLDSFSFAGTETYDGVRVRRYVMDETAPWLAAQQQSDGEIRWTDFSYEVLVDDQGLVRSEHWSGAGVDDAGTKKAVEFTYELSGVGSTDVTEPVWLDQARA
ncbi:MAG: hypothetical protein ABEJ82_01820 [Haloplanus sp.]